MNLRDKQEMQDRRQLHREVGELIIKLQQQPGRDNSELVAMLKKSPPVGPQAVPLKEARRIRDLVVQRWKNPLASRMPLYYPDAHLGVSLVTKEPNKPEGNMGTDEEAAADA